MKLLEIKDLSVQFSVHGKILQAVRGISFDILAGETVGIVGESGSGKSAAVQAITKLSQAEKIGGSALFEGVDLLKEKELKHIRGRKIGMIFQDPMSSLNPTMRIGAQIMEGLLFHKLHPKEEAKRKALEWLKIVGVPDPIARFSQYPHELSGGMRQRVLIAIALACSPKLLIADEPTTALDVTIQAQILDMLKNLQKRFQMSLLLITHDMGVVSEICKKVIVMYAGKIVEMGSVDEILKSPKHPYTQMLLRSRPNLESTKEIPLTSIDGSPPNLLDPPKGCAFKERCPFAANICDKDPPFIKSTACWRVS
ncbi:MAG: peptide ABC transporter ATP-binding protein [Chlamydiae bacterium RIFCSPHIGHO2_12_FULL_49_9]|nr:MAG: peptide ABC transporter ATP-binding protein [Chlamydiae bacterium RIFCSPHIGHO2_12_FULL_49_9]